MQPAEVKPLLDTLQSSPDIAAMLWFCAAIFGYRLFAGFGPFERRSIVGAIQRQRERWLLNMAVRDGRIVDAHLLGGLAQGNAFFASTSALIIEVKLILLITIFIYAFFKFAWAFRLSHYASIMIGATPILEADRSNLADCAEHASRTAKLIGIAAEHANGGLRAFYYAIAAMGWFFHPLVFAAVTTWVVLILLRRDFFSRSRRLIAGA